MRSGAIVVLLAVTVPAYALSLSDKTVTVDVVADLQIRAGVANGTAPDGDDFDVERARAGRGDDLDLTLPLVRLGLVGSVRRDWRFAIGFQSVDVDAGGTGQNRAVALWQAWVGRSWKEGDQAHTLAFGLDDCVVNRAGTGVRVRMFPTPRPCAQFLPEQGVGVRYSWTGPGWTWSVDLENNTGGNRPVVNAYDGDSVFLGTRLEWASGAKPMPWKESYVGESGSGVILAGLAAIDQSVQSDPAGAVDTVVLGGEALVHVDALTVLGDATWRHQDGPAETNGMILGIQAGWCRPFLDGMWIEPAIRVNLIDLDTSTDEASAYTDAGGPGSPYGASGWQGDAGVTWYVSGHSQKVQLSYTRWQAEAESGRADILRLQYGLNF